MSTTRRGRPGYTILELLAVLAVIIIIGAVVLPSTSTLWGSSRSDAAADQVRGELAAARSWAIQEGIPVRVALSADGTKLRRGPESEFDQTFVPESTPGARRTEVTFEKVTAELTADGDESRAPEADGWRTVAVFLSDGTCRVERGTNPSVSVSLREEGRTVAGLRVTVRPLTGETRVVRGGTPTGGTP